MERVDSMDMENDTDNSNTDKNDPDEQILWLDDPSPVNGAAPLDDLPSTTDDVPNTIIQPLKCNPPDLEIVVGSSTNHQYTFQCHSAILASQSAYVDTMLSVPMKEQSAKRITFPDIEHDTWIRLIHFLTPSGSRQLQVTDIPELLPIFDKYEFRQGLKLCDDIISTTTIQDVAKLYKDNHNLKGRDATRKVQQKLYTSLEFVSYVQALELSCQIELMPKSKKVAIEFAETQLRLGFANKFANTSDNDNDNNDGIRNVDGNHHNTIDDYDTIIDQKVDHGSITRLLSLIGDETLNYILIDLTMGNNGSSTTIMEETRNEIKKESFPSLYLERFQEIRQQEDVVRNMNINGLCISVPDAELIFLNGTYESYWTNPMYGQGAMLQCYKKYDEEYEEYHLIKANDPFGRSWGIFRVHIDDFDFSTKDTRQSVCHWRTHYNSVLPPRRGWKSDINGLTCALKIQYQHGT